MSLLTQKYLWNDFIRWHFVGCDVIEGKIVEKFSTETIIKDVLCPYYIKFGCHLNMGSNNILSYFFKKEEILTFEYFIKYLRISCIAFNHI